MIIVLIICVIVILVLSFIVINLLRKNEKQEDVLIGYLNYLDNISKAIEVSDIKLKQLDINGAFSNDDETGTIFESILKIQKLLNEFQLKNISTDAEKKDQ